MDEVGKISWVYFIPICIDKRGKAGINIKISGGSNFNGATSTIDYAILVVRNSSKIELDIGSSNYPKINEVRKGGRDINLVSLGRKLSGKDTG